jgi:uncharacterized membrane protein
MSAVHHDLLAQLRARVQSRRVVTPTLAVGPRLADRTADGVAAIVGSWRFILIQSGLLVAWIAANAMFGARWDPYPFILLNLVLSFQAAYTAPIIMMSQNRQADVDRQRAIEDFEINQKAELEIESLHQKIDLLRETEIAALSASVERLTRLLEAQAKPA